MMLEFASLVHPRKSANKDVERGACAIRRARFARVGKSIYYDRGRGTLTYERITNESLQSLVNFRRFSARPRAGVSENEDFRSLPESKRAYLWINRSLSPPCEKNRQHYVSLNDWEFGYYQIW